MMRWWTIARRLWDELVGTELRHAGVGSTGPEGTLHRCRWALAFATVDIVVLVVWHLALASS